jgi:hypothetical protein
LSGSAFNGVTRVTLGFRGDQRCRAREFWHTLCAKIALINGP